MGAGRGQAWARGTPPPCGATSVIDVHTANVCDYVNALSSSARYCRVVHLGLFRFVFLSPFCFYVSFRSVRWVVFFPPFPCPPLLSMKLENLKDCCVFVNNRNDCALRACTCPSSELLLPEPLSPGMCSVSRAPRPRVNVWDQTLCSGCAQVTLATKRHCRQGEGPPQPRSPGRGALSWLSLLRSNGLFFTACQFLNCVAISFFMEKKKEKKQKMVPFNLFAQMQKTYSI